LKRVEGQPSNTSLPGIRSLGRGDAAGVDRYHQGQLYVIDVSQSVEYDHPNALEFLRKDCVNVNNYFRRRHGVATMTAKELFDFITDLSITDLNVDDYLAAAMKTASGRSPADVSRLEADEEVKQNVPVVFCLSSYRRTRVTRISLDVPPCQISIEVILLEVRHPRSFVDGWIDLGQFALYTQSWILSVISRRQCWSVAVSSVIARCFQQASVVACLWHTAMMDVSW